MKREIEDIIREAKSMGFSEVGELDSKTITLKQEVRDMCASNTCGMYGKNWSCPPGSGELDICREELKDYKYGVIVQTVGDIEDSFDFEGMMEVQDKHTKMYEDFAEVLKKKYKKVLCLGTGTCTICKECTYPDNPCRFPDKQISSMESYGMLVSEICKDNNMKYYYGSDKICYTACYLIEF